MLIVPKKKWRYPLAIEREYAKLLVAYVEKEIEIVESFIPEMVDSVYRNAVRSDGIGDWLSNTVGKIKRKVKEKLSALPAIKKIFGQVNKHVSTQMTEIFESVFGSRPRQFNNTRELETLKNVWVSQNLTLIKSIDQQILDRIQSILTSKIIHASTKPELLEQLTQEIQELARVERNRAALIATDQVGKLNSQLTQFRQTSAGIEEYVWNTRKDNRVRPLHAEREGKVFKWSQPPSDGHPGWAIRCRCTASPVYDDEKIGMKPKTGSYGKTDLMSHNFRPSLTSHEINIGQLPVKQVRNSQFTMYVDSNIGEKEPIIRNTEMLLRSIRDRMPNNYRFPPVVITDMEKTFGRDAIGGFQRSTGRLYLHSKYDTLEKIKEYVSRYDGNFANTTEYAPLLHELGHRYYYDLIKKVAKKRKILYNNSKELIDKTVEDWAIKHISNDRTIERILSQYADEGFWNKSYTEVVAEAYSVSDNNRYAQELLALLEELY